MRENQIRAASMRSACCVCFRASLVSRDFSLRSTKALTACLVSALKRMASLSFSDMGRTVCYHSGMWEILQLLWYMFWYMCVPVILPVWIWFKVFDWFFPSDD